MSKPLAIVTGASSGIGLGLAYPVSFALRAEVENTAVTVSA